MKKYYKLLFLLPLLASCQTQISSSSPFVDSSFPEHEFNPDHQYTYQFKKYDKFKESYDVFKKKNPFPAIVFDLDTLKDFENEYSIIGVSAEKEVDSYHLPDLEFTLPSLLFEYKWENIVHQDGAKDLNKSISVELHYQEKMNPISDFDNEKLSFNKKGSYIEIAYDSSPLLKAEYVFGEDLLPSEQRTFFESLKENAVFLS